MILRLTMLFVFFACFSTSVFSQSEQDLDWYVNRVEFLDKAVYKLDYSKEYIRETIVPEVEQNRVQIAPHYPELKGVFGDDRKALIQSWISSYPEEGTAYITYLESFIRSHK